MPIVLYYISMLRIGSGYDSHRLVAGRRLIIGGVEINHEKGLSGHSDADVLAHAVIDALLGAVADGDIGYHFPDSDPRWLDADSMQMLAMTANDLIEKGWHLVNLDATVIAQRPRMASYIPLMRAKLAAALRSEIDTISVKAKSNEGMGFIGREEGIAVIATVLLEKKSDTKPRIERL